MKQIQAFPALPLPFIAPFIGFDLPIANQKNLREPTGREGHGREDFAPLNRILEDFPFFLIPPDSLILAELWLTVSLRVDTL